MGTVTQTNTVQWYGRVLQAFQPCSGPVNLVLQARQYLALVDEHSPVSVVAAVTQNRV